MVTSRGVVKAILLLSTTSLLAIPLSSLGRAHGGHESYSAGEPGAPKKPARSVTIFMKDAGGKMVFVPDHLDVRKGEQIKFILRNEGDSDHEFVLATTAENLKHAEIMKKNPDMEHDDPNMIRLAPKTRTELLWKFTKPGKFEFSCLIPGHREAGMLGTILVK